MKRTYVTLILLCPLILTGCVTREQADAKLARGCRAGVQALLPDGETIDHLTGTEFSKADEGQDMRHVKLHAVTGTGEDKDYDCVFEEQFGLLNLSYTASVYQVKAGAAVYGNVEGEIVGDAQDFVKLTDAVRQAMYDDAGQNKPSTDAPGSAADNN